MKKLIFSLFLIFFISTPIYASKEVSFTIDDRDRLIRVETKVEEGLKAVNQRIDSLQNLLYVLIAAVIAQTVGVIGFVLWDRRTALAPSLRKNKELEEREEKLERVLKEYAKQEPKLAEILKNLGLM
ncbi:hypothetical protein [Thermodesulfovibrio hydrogeniphilus]